MGETAVVTVLELLFNSAASAGLPSSPSSIEFSGSTTEVLTSGPVAGAVPLIVIVPLAPALIWPPVHVTSAPATLHEKRLVPVAVIGKAVSSGTVSVTSIPVAAASPTLLTVSV